MARPTRLSVVADTGAIYALVDASDQWHARVIEWWRVHGHLTVLPVTILPEVTWLLQSRIGVLAEEAFVRSIANGEFAVEPLEEEDLQTALELMAKYRDLPLGFVDATVLAITRRLSAHEILTTDRRHFGVVRSRQRSTIGLVP